MSPIRFATGVLALSGLAAGCSPDAGSTKAAPADKAADSVAVQKAAQQYRVHYNTPVSLDSTDFYYQPISVVSMKGESPSRSYESGSSYGSSDYQETRQFEGTCYNVLFLRKSNQQEHLLLPHSQFVITRIDDEMKPDARWPYLFYTVHKADTNADGEQNGRDATTLFVSDRSGRQFRQLTPNGEDVVSRHYLEKASILLVEVRPDVNQDREYTPADGTYWLRFDLRNLTAPPLRQPAPALGRQLQQQMLRRQSRPSH